MGMVVGEVTWIQAVIGKATHRLLLGYLGATTTMVEMNLDSAHDGERGMDD